MQESTKPAELADVIKSEKFIETAILLLFVSIFIFVKLAQPWDSRIVHPFPAFYNANDNFVNGYAFPESIKETGNFAYEPSYAVEGYKDVIGYYPPLLLHLSAMFSLLSGIQTYDTTNLLAILFSIPPILLIYFVIRRYSKEIALLSIPFMLGVYNFDFEVERVFGQWIYITGAMFLASVVWSMDLLYRKYSFILLALFMAGAALGHMSEAIFAAGFLAFYALMTYLKDKVIDKLWLKNAATGFGAFLLLSAYYLIIFKYTWVVGAHTYKFEVMDVSPISANYGVHISDLGIVLLPMTIGLLIGLKRLAFRKKEEFPFTAVAAGLFILVIGYTNYIGFGLRAWQTRHAWPIYFAIFSGFALYYLGNKVLKNWNLKHYAAVSLILLLSFSYLHWGALRGGGMVDQSGWDTLMWIKSSTPEDAKVFYFQGILISQPFSVWAAQRVPYTTSFENYAAGAKNGIVDVNYTVWAFAEDANAFFPYRKSLLSYGYHSKEKERTPSAFSAMDYYVLTVAPASAGNSDIAQYNLAIRDALLKKEGISEAYKNGEYSVLKRNR